LTTAVLAGCTPFKTTRYEAASGPPVEDRLDRASAACAEWAATGTHYPIACTNGNQCGRTAVWRPVAGRPDLLQADPLDACLRYNGFVRITRTATGGACVHGPGSDRCED
jgi:hypothetical protein